MNTQRWKSSCLFNVINLTGGVAAAALGAGSTHHSNLFAIEYGEEAQEIFTTLEANFAYTLKDLGATTVDPADLGIEKT